MPTVKELLSSAVINKEPELPQETVEEIQRRKALKKLNKVKRLQALSNDGATVSFLAYTPGTSQGRPVHGTILKDITVKKTLEGYYVVVGRDLEEELKTDISNGCSSSDLSVLRKRDKDKAVFRSYRIDRIIDGSISWS